MIESVQITNYLCKRAMNEREELSKVHATIDMGSCFMS